MHREQPENSVLKDFSMKVDTRWMRQPFEENLVEASKDKTHNRSCQTTVKFPESLAETFKKGKVSIKRKQLPSDESFQESLGSIMLNSKERECILLNGLDSHTSGKQKIKRKQESPPLKCVELYS